MKYISSDTDVWIDFITINRLELPFKLPYIYLMNEEAMADELLQPKGFYEKLVQFGLQATEMTEEEYYLADEYNAKYMKPSLYDCIALSIAKCRGIALLSGDGPLRKAAKQEGVNVIGTIGILDQLYNEDLISRDEYFFCLTELDRNNGEKVRLPSKELQQRIDHLKALNEME